MWKLLDNFAGDNFSVAWYCKWPGRFLIFFECVQTKIELRLWLRIQFEHNFFFCRHTTREFILTIRFYFSYRWRRPHNNKKNIYWMSKNHVKVNTKRCETIQSMEHRKKIGSPHVHHLLTQYMSFSPSRICFNWPTLICKLFDENTEKLDAISIVKWTQ